VEQVIVVGAGQAGLAAARALQLRDLRPTILEAGPEAAGSWGRYYDSLRLFTPAWLNALPGMPFPGDPYRYPGRDEVVGYLRDYAAWLGCEIRTCARVRGVSAEDGAFSVRTDAGELLRARAVVVASGQFANPHRPALPPLEGYSGRVIHAAEYRCPDPYQGERVVVIGSGNSAVQIAVEIASVARVSIVSRSPIHYATTEPVPGRSRFWKLVSLASRVPAGRLFSPRTIPIIDTGGYRAAIEAGHPGWRQMPCGSDGQVLRWADGSAERVDTVILATGYRPALGCLEPLGVLEASGRPEHRAGLSRTMPGLAFVGLDYQRTILSATMHGVGRDAAYVARALAAHLDGSHAVLG
jgi:putative flavoprotein involved in K+ transport